MPIARVLVLCTLLLAPCAAAADLSPEDLWQRWQDRAAAAGQTLDAQVEQGAALGLRGLTVTRVLPAGTLTARFDRVELSARGPDLRIALPAGQQVTLTARAPGSEDMVAVFALGDTSLLATVRGDLDAHDIVLDGQAFSARLVSLTQDGTAIDADMRLDIAGLGGTLSGLDGSGAALVADLAASALANEIRARDPGTGAELTSTATQRDVALRAEQRPGGGPLTARLEGADATSVTRNTGPGGTLETDSRQETSRLAVTAGPLRTDYSAAVTGLSTTVSGTQLPMGPVSVTLGAADLSLSLPTPPAPGDAAETGLQTARIALSLRDAMPGDALWDAVDPSGRFPRSPAQLDLAIEAEVDPAAPVTAPGGEDLPAMAPRALRIDRLALDFAGAALTGTGGFTIPEGPGGVPDITRPVGEMTLRADGIAGLLQAAAAAGIVNQDQMMGAQMMLGMFAVQGPDGSLISTIEAREDGALLVNGNRMR